jgi:ATP-dependent DNA helicase RecG
MPAAVDPKTLLQRVLVLERQQGFQDRAAVGGLADFVRQQIERADAPARPVLLRVAEDLGNYGSADRRGREAAVAAALRSLLTGATPRPARPRVLPGGAPPQEQTIPAPVPPERPKLSVVHRPEELDESVSRVKGVRKQWVDALARQGVTSIRDLLYYFPRTHYDYTERRSISRLRLGDRTTLVGTIENVRNNRTARGAVITTASISDDTGYVAVRWFNQPYLPQQLPVGARIAISGEPDVHNGFITFKPRDWELIEEADLTHAGRLVPIYPLTKGLFQKSLRRLIRSTVEGYASAVEEYLPPGLTESLRLPELGHAIRQYHFPDDEEQRAWAEQRLAFDELLLIQLGLLLRKRSWQQELPDVAVPVELDLDRQFRDSLPFALTHAQDAVLEEIYADLARPVPMSRLLEGDVGSGKTVVAAAALLQVANAGRQGVLMAPTEILAEQHARTLAGLLAPFGVECHLLIGSTPAKARKVVYAASADGRAHVVVGTHALIQEGIEFNRLGLAITDEQHRFGVEQRATLRQKGLHPHVLAMTATPFREPWP